MSSFLFKSSLTDHLQMTQVFHSLNLFRHAFHLKLYFVELAYLSTVLRRILQDKIQRTKADFCTKSTHIPTYDFNSFGLLYLFCKMGLQKKRSMMTCETGSGDRNL